MKRTVDASSLLQANHVGRISFLEGFVFSKSPFPKHSVVETLTFSFGLSRLLWIVFHSTHISPRALTFCGPLHAVSTVYLSFALGLVLGCSGARGGLFQVLFHDERNASHEFPVPGVGPQYFSLV